MSKIGIWAVAAVAVGTMLYLIYTAATFEAPQGRTTVVIAPPVQAEPEPVIQQESETSVLPQSIFRPEAEPAAVADTEVEIAELPEEIELPEPDPVEIETPTSVPSVRLPSLNASDGFVFDQLRELSASASLISYLASDQIVRKFVVFVENISRGEFPQTGLPYRPIEADMQVSNLDENLYVMEEISYSRFDQVINTFLSVDTDAALLLYRVLSPLFQQAYGEIGFRDESFDDSLRLAINNVLKTSDQEGPYQLVKPSVMYLYADSSIENLQEVHKQLIRIGPENTEKLKAKLLDFASRL